MRFANIIVVILGLICVAFALFVSWTSRQLPLRSPNPVDDDSGWRVRIHAASMTVGAAIAAGAVSGVLVLGLVGRLVMRILAATSSDVQGRLTEAGESIGEITSGGTIAFLIFVGLGGGIVSAFGYLVIRPWLPAKVGQAGLLFAVLVIGTLGVGDALSPDNVDFDILTPRWLAVALIVATGFLFGTTFAALAARFDRVAQNENRMRRWFYPVLAISLLPPLTIGTVLHIGIRSIAPDRLNSFSRSARVQLVGRILVVAATILAAFFSASAAIEILTA